jgi:tetratricopeptide (TPR) repeat protein
MCGFRQGGGESSDVIQSINMNSAGASICFWVILVMTWFGRLDVAAESIYEQHWYETRTAHFQIYSCGETQEVARLAARLEQFREAYSVLAGGQAVASPPIVVMAFPDHDSMKPFLPLYQGKPANLTAFFKPASDENLIVLPLESAISLEAIFHEYTHLLLRHNDPIWPLWLKEGMAEIYGTFEPIGGKRARIGKPIGRHLRLLSQEKMMPLADLFAVSHDSAEYNEEQHQGIFYAESWFLTHYLMLGAGPTRKAQFGQLTGLLRQGQGPLQAFTNAFRVPAAVVERELQQYLKREKLDSLDLVLNTDLTAPRALSRRPITASETCFRLGDQLLRVRRPDAAQSYFERARELAPRSPLPFEGLGLLASERDQPTQALQYLDDAMQRGPVSFLAHFIYAKEKFRLAAQSGDTYSQISNEPAVEIRRELQKSLALMPDFGPGHHLLGFFELVQGNNLPLAREHLQRSIQLEPENQEYLFALAQAEFLINGMAAARQTLEGLQRPNVSPKLRQQTEVLLRELERKGTQR